MEPRTEPCGTPLDTGYPHSLFPVTKEFLNPVK